MVFFICLKVLTNNTNINNMALKPLKTGDWKIKTLPKTASVTFTNGDLVMFTSGYVATATAQSTKHLGIILQSVTSGDSNFASATNVKVAVPSSLWSEFEADVTGTLLTTSLGVQYDMSTAGLVNKAGTTYKVVTCVGFISTAKGRFILNSNMAFADITWD